MELAWGYKQFCAFPEDARRPSGTQQPLNFVLETNTFRKVPGPGSGAGAAR